MLHTDIPHSTSLSVNLGCAGWTIRREHSAQFSGGGSHLERYAALFNSVEINSCFYRPHRFSTYERWAASVPEDFRFSLKLPKVITHEARLVDAVPALERFLAETSGLGPKRGPVLVQLPPSFAFDSLVAGSFFTELRSRFEGDVVFEPRHETWFTEEVESMLRDYRIARVAADPARVPAAAEFGGYDRLPPIRRVFQRQPSLVVMTVWSISGFTDRHAFTTLRIRPRHSPMSRGSSRTNRHREFPHGVSLTIPPSAPRQRTPWR